MLGKINRIKSISGTLTKAVEIVTKIIEVEGKGDHRRIELVLGQPIKKVNTRILPLKYEMAENLSQEMV